jgi:hypothetical protein
MIAQAMKTRMGFSVLIVSLPFPDTILAFLLQESCGAWDTVERKKLPESQGD